MAIDLNDKPWYVAVIIGAVLGIALFVVLQMYVFKDMQTEITNLETTIDELEREIEKGRAAKADQGIFNGSSRALCARTNTTGARSSMKSTYLC